MEIKIGDKVKINKKIVIRYIGNTPDWYTPDIYTICNISASGNIIFLDKILTGYTNQIHKEYIISIREERKQKLEKLNENW